MTSPQVTNVKNIRYTSCTNYLPHQVLKVWKHWVQNCGCGRMSNLINCVLRWRHLTWPGGLTWYDLGSTFLHKTRKGWMNSYAKFGGASRHRFSAIYEKPMGHIYAPPGRARVKEKLRIKDHSYHFSTNIGLKCMHAGNEHEYNY